MRLSRERIGASGNMDVGGARRAIGPGLGPGLRRSSPAGIAVRCRQNGGQIKSESRSDKFRTAVKCGQILQEGTHQAAHHPQSRAQGSGSRLGRAGQADRLHRPLRRTLPDAACHRGGRCALRGAPHRRAFAVRSAVGGDRLSGCGVRAYCRARLLLRGRAGRLHRGASPPHSLGLGPVLCALDDELRHPRRRKQAASFRARPQVIERLLAERAGIGETEIGELRNQHARAGRYLRCQRSRRRTERP